MKITSILISLLLIVIFSCEKNPSNNEPVEEGNTFSEEEIDYSICENCIWLQSTCDGKWTLGYNIEQSAIGGFQFTIEDATIININSGEVLLDSGFIFYSLMHKSALSSTLID